MKVGIGNKVQACQLRDLVNGTLFLYKTQPVRAEGLGRNGGGVLAFPHAVGVRGLWKTERDSVIARRPNGLPAFATVSFVYDTPTAQVYTGVMDSLIGQSTNLDDQVTP